MASVLRTFFVLAERLRWRRDHGRQIICLVSVGQDRPILTRSGSGDPELQILGQLNRLGFFRKSLTKNATFAKIHSVLNILAIFRANLTDFTIFPRKTLTKNRNSCRMWLIVNISTIFPRKTLTKNRNSCRMWLIVNISTIFREKMFDIYCMFVYNSCKRGDTRKKNAPPRNRTEERYRAPAN